MRKRSFVWGCSRARLSATARVDQRTLSSQHGKACRGLGYRLGRFAACVPLAHAHREAPGRGSTVKQSHTKLRFYAKFAV